MKELLGAPVAQSLVEAAKARVLALADKGVTPRLAIVRVGDDPGDLWYQNAAAKRLGSAGVEVTAVELSRSVGREELERVLEDLSQDELVHGILVLRPLPEGLDEAAVLDKICFEKDVDGACRASMGGLYAGDPRAFAPCTAEAVMALLRHYGYELRGANVCVLGRSLVVGRPLALLLLAQDATVAVAHSRSIEKEALCRHADLVVSAMGRAGTVTDDWLRPGAWFVDVGTSEDEDGKICGDGLWDSVCEVAGAATPVPRGVGSVTTAVLLDHVVSAAERQTAGEGGPRGPEPGAAEPDGEDLIFSAAVGKAAEKKPSGS